MKRKNLYSNISQNLEIKFFFSNKNLREKIMKVLDIKPSRQERYPNSRVRVCLSIASTDHWGRLIMDATKNMIEAIIDGDLETAQGYARSANIQPWYEEYIKMDLRQLIEARLCENGWRPSKEDDKVYEDFLKFLG